MKKYFFHNSQILMLVLMSVATPIAFNGWSALLNNFVVERASFTGIEIGILQSIREIPGFLAVGVILVLLFWHEQTVACLTLLLLGFATAITTLLPSFQGLLLTTLLGSIGFHYFETVNQSLQLHWLNKKKAPVILGVLISVGSLTSLVIYSVIVFGIIFGYIILNEIPSTNMIIGASIISLSGLFVINREKKLGKIE